MPEPTPPARFGLLLNPRSSRVRPCYPALRAQAAALPGVDLREAATPPTIAAAVHDWTAQGLALIVVVGGDGSLQALLTALLRTPPAALPALLVVPAGTTNMSARDLGARRRPEAALQALAAWLAGRGPAPQATPRAVLRVDASAEAQFGLFFGAGAVLSGVRYFHRHLDGRGLRGLGPTLAMGRLLLSLLRGRPHPLLPVTPARLTLDDPPRQGDWLLVFASTLHRLLAGSRPYWGCEPAPVHVTAVRQAPQRLARVLPFLLSGRGAGVAREADGYLSRNLAGLQLDGPAEYLIDGETFAADRPIDLSATAPVRFLAY